MPVADKPLDDFELTAAAIAIMSSFMYMDSDEEVRQKIRADNAEFLEFARLDRCLAIGHRHGVPSEELSAGSPVGLGGRILQGRGARDEPGTGKKNNLENYYWASTSVETLKKLKAVAIRDGLADAYLTKCCERLEKWVVSKGGRCFKLRKLYEESK